MLKSIVLLDKVFVAGPALAAAGAMLSSTVKYCYNIVSTNKISFHWQNCIFQLYFYFLTTHELQSRLVFIKYFDGAKSQNAFYQLKTIGINHQESKATIFVNKLQFILCKVQPVLHYWFG